MSLNQKPLVTIIIPCLNEASFIAMCLDSIICNDYPKSYLEVLVVDGMSEDGTRDIVEKYIKNHGFIKLVSNPKKNTPIALNLGIKSAKGEVILRMDAHAKLGENYISRCVECLKEYRADNVGGVMNTINRTAGLRAHSIALTLSHFFGVGNSYFRIHPKDPKWVDTVFGGCYRKDVFRRVGMFNEALIRGQDMEFNLRLKKAGGKILLVPDIVSYYYARSDIKSFWKHNWGNGVWAILPFMYSDIVPVSWRHLVPLVFVMTLVTSALLGFMMPPFLWLFLIVITAYGIVSLTVSVKIAWDQRDIKYFFMMPVTFCMLHIGYGLGSFWGILKLAVNPLFWSKAFSLRRKYEAG